MPTGRVWIYRLLFVCFFCNFIIFVRIRIAPVMIKLAASKFIIIIIIIIIIIMLSRASTTTSQVCYKLRRQEYHMESAIYVLLIFE